MPNQKQYADGSIADLAHISGREASSDAAVTDPTLSASDIALLKGLLKQLQGTGTGSTPVQQTGSNAQVADTTAVWANSAAVNTAVDKDIALPSALQADALYEIIVTNPSTVSDITVIVKNKETFGGTARYPELTRFGVSKNTVDGKAFLVQGWLLGEAGRVTLSNDTVLGVADGFTSYIRVRKV